MKYKSNNNVVYSCKYHVIWCPKYRHKVLVGNISERLKELIIQRCSEINTEIIKMEIMPDHVHLLIEVDPQFGINKAVRSIKGFSSHTLRKEFKELTTKLPTLWTNSYFVSTIGGLRLKSSSNILKAKRLRKGARKLDNIASETYAYVKTVAVINRNNSPVYNQCKRFG